ncbi:STAS domain-containing protein [Streptomyces sp. SID13666]|uniref:STAS domain-containing protein n=1 Tax=Streptomyces sp. SID13666 TaxID=2706054 RepID=UPI0013C27C2F|nr:STAS domain-containing protein [Streptomyces sp. SID13666]NEA53568.1 STAS domain-containing protein [Streptomyces sp. SID13666]
MAHPENPHEQMLDRTVAVHLPFTEARTLTWAGTDGRPVLGFEDAQMTHLRHGPHTVVTVEGILGVYEAPTLRERLTDLIDTGDGDVIVDVRGVGILDSTNLGVLIAACKRIRIQRRGRTLYLVAKKDTGPVHRIMLITGLIKVFYLCDSVTNALRAATTASPAADEQEDPR